jgi:hypothetical protein
MAKIIGVDQVRRQYAESAPDAPVLPPVERPPRTHRARAASARVLIRLANAITPPEPACR